MPVGLVPIDHAAAVLRVDLHVLGTTHRTAVFDAGCLDTLENRIKVFLVDTEAEVLDWKRSVIIDEVEGQSVIDVHGRERPRTGFRPADTEQGRQTFGRNALISRRHDDVIEFNGHLRILSQVSEPVSGLRVTDV